LAVTKAVNQNRLPPARECKCADCVRPASAYDHRDYNLPLAVVPVCHTCNLARGAAVAVIYTRTQFFSMVEKQSGIPHLAKTLPHFIRWAAMSKTAPDYLRAFTVRAEKRAAA
jgi:hypothetical protein